MHGGTDELKGGSNFFVLWLFLLGFSNFFFSQPGNTYNTPNVRYHNNRVHNREKAHASSNHAPIICATDPLLYSNASQQNGSLRASVHARRGLKLSKFLLSLFFPLPSTTTLTAGLLACLNTLPPCSVLLAVSWARTLALSSLLPNDPRPTSKVHTRPAG